MLHYLNILNLYLNFYTYQNQNFLETYVTEELIDALSLIFPRCVLISNSWDLYNVLKKSVEDEKEGIPKKEDVLKKEDDYDEKRKNLQKKKSRKV